MSNCQTTSAFPPNINRIKMAKVTLNRGPRLKGLVPAAPILAPFVTSNLLPYLGRASTEPGYLDQLLFEVSRSFRRTFLPSQHRMHSLRVGCTNLLISGSYLNRRPPNQINPLLNWFLRISVHLGDRG